MHILRTRLHKPILKPNFISRVKILNYLDSRADNPLTLIVAAAGYGKSITASQWLEHRGSKYGWVSLDKDCNDLALFLKYIASSVEISYPNSMTELLSISKVEKLPTIRVISDIINNSLLKLNEEFILVLDDYHLIDNFEIHSLINEILKFPSKNLKLFILSRKDPILNLRALKAYDFVNEIRMSNLMFEINEAEELFWYNSERQIHRDVIEKLVGATEGWIIGLRLAMLSILKGRKLKEVLNDLTLEKKTISQFMMYEILDPQSENVRNCFFKTSILSSFCEDLVNYVCSNEEFDESPSEIISRNLFAETIDKTLFIIPLDFETKWYRFHHIFCEVLYHQLEKNYTPVYIQSLHRRASLWYNKEGYYQEAFKHALQSGDIDLTINLIKERKYLYIDNDQFGILRKWLDQLPNEVIEENTDLILLRAFLFDSIKDFTSMRDDLRIAERLLLEKKSDNLTYQNQLRGELHCMYSNLKFNERNFSDAYEHSVKAFELLTKKSEYLIDFTLFHHTASLAAMGKIDDALAIIEKLLKETPSFESATRIRKLIIQSILYSFQGNLPIIIEKSLEYHAISQKKKLWISLSYSTYYLSEANYQLNNLQEALNYSNALENHFYTGRPVWVLQTLYTKAFVLNVLGKFQDLNHTIQLVKQITEYINLPVFDNFTRAFEVEMAIRQNNMNKANKLSNTTDFNCYFPIHGFYFPQITNIKLLILSDEADSIIEAEQKLGELIDFSKASYNYNIVMQAKLLQSLLFNHKGQSDAAIDALKEAIKLAESGGFIRIFVDLGNPIKTMVEELYSLDPEFSYISRIHSAFMQEKSVHEKVKDLELNITPTFKSNGFGMLSQRDIGLIKLISEGYQNKEIAEKLFLSPNSVKKYIYDIYQKLDVKNRTHAVNKAKQLNII